MPWRLKLSWISGFSSSTGTWPVSTSYAADCSTQARAVGERMAASRSAFPAVMNEYSPATNRRTSSRVRLVALASCSTVPPLRQTATAASR